MLEVTGDAVHFSYTTVHKLYKKKVMVGYKGHTIFLLKDINFYNTNQIVAQIPKISNWITVCIKDPPF